MEWNHLEQVVYRNKEKEEEICSEEKISNFRNDLYNDA